MVDVQQVTVEVEMSIPSSLDSGVGRLAGGRAGREVELCKDGKGGQVDARDALCGEFLSVDNDDFLYVGVGGLVPVGSERGHFGWSTVL